MPLYTCITCRVGFADSDLQRKHYKSDWHRYNLKRKVAEMPPVTAEVFQEKVLAQRAEAEAKEQTKSTIMYCKICNKNFSSENAYKNYLQSKKHLEIVAKSKDTDSEETADIVGLKKKSENSVQEADTETPASDEEEVEECEDEALEITECLFCPHESLNFEENMKHMSRSHSFFIPDLEYVVDLKGLIGYLGEKIGIGKMCLFCNEKSKAYLSIEAVQNHMTSKSHMKLDYEGEAALEYSDWYDFTSSYPSKRENDDDDNDVNTGTLSVDDATNELCLPSGAKAGHRDLRNYYKQHLPPERENHKVKKSIMADYKALGWHGTIAEKTRQTLRDARVERQQMAKHQVKLAVKANKFQTHFRPQVIF
ncbi:zinc finger protein 622-like [Actinia tenebrosa]|uniref:Zinc finger protein 622-like n=1 Tax=Actinia tenebrosa TaxID=6105 RepID=A0A6P8IUQ1_ACTTE|nr:zinc finger protein 622-like [Actinia tenebrosa]